MGRGSYPGCLGLGLLHLMGQPRGVLIDPQCILFPAPELLGFVSEVGPLSPLTEGMFWGLRRSGNRVLVRPGSVTCQLCDFGQVTCHL